MADYVTARKIQDEPDFAWWLPFTVRKRDIIIAAVNFRVMKVTHKYGIEITTSVEYVEEIDKMNQNTFWKYAINLEISYIGIAFKILDRGETMLSGYKKSSGHMIYTVNMDFTRKAWWFKDGHLTQDPESLSYAGVVSRKSIRILLTHAAMNSVPIMAADVCNTYLQAPTF